VLAEYVPEGRIEHDRTLGSLNMRSRRMHLGRLRSHVDGVWRGAQRRTRSSGVGVETCLFARERLQCGVARDAQDVFWMESRRGGRAEGRSSWLCMINARAIAVTL